MLTPAMRAICLPYRSDPLTLTLLVTRFRANDSHHPVAPDDLAVAADLLHRCQYFHCRFSVNRRASTRAAEISAAAEPCLPVPHHLARKMIRARDRSYGVRSTVTLSPGKIFM